MNIATSERGSAPTLAIFTIFIIISSSLVILHLQSMEREEISEIQRLMASDTVQATNSSIEAELNDLLYTSITAAMYDVGISAGTEENVENQIIEYLNNRIEENWKYPNIDVNVPLATENSIRFEWQPDGSLVVRGYLNSEIKHVKGPTAHGMFLRASPYPRFQRIKHIAEQISRKIERTSFDRVPPLEEKLNENYECEKIEIILENENSHISIKIMDMYGGKSVVLG